MHVNPVIRKHVSLLHDQRHRYQVAMFQTARRRLRGTRKGRRKRGEEFANWHGRDHMSGLVSGRLAVLLHNYLGDPRAGVRKAHYSCSQLNSSSARLDMILEGLPHHAWTKPRIFELTDERLDV